MNSAIPSRRAPASRKRCGLRSRPGRRATRTGRPTASGRSGDARAELHRDVGRARGRWPRVKPAFASALACGVFERVLLPAVAPAATAGARRRSLPACARPATGCRCETSLSTRAHAGAAAAATKPVGQQRQRDRDHPVHHCLLRFTCRGLSSMTALGGGRRRSPRHRRTPGRRAGRPRRWFGASRTGRGSGPSGARHDVAHRA